jgi:hypothetical protein
MKLSTPPPPCIEFDSDFAEENPGRTFSIECISVGIDVGEIRVRMWFDLTFRNRASYI